MRNFKLRVVNHYLIITFGEIHIVLFQSCEKVQKVAVLLNTDGEF